MYYSALLVAATAFTSFVAAQNTSLPIAACCTLDPNTITQANKTSWCRAQTNTCPEVCGGYSGLNQSCDATSLTWSCTCGDGSKPNISDYQQSVPAQECREWFSRCIVASGQDLEQQLACKAITCGNKTTDAAQSSVAASSSPTGSAASSSGSGASAASATTSATSTAKTGAATALAIAREYGTPLLAGGMAALFGLAL